MTYPTLRLLCLSFLVLALCACDRPQCRNTVPAFDQYACDSQPYRAELARLLKQTAPGDLSYWLEAYHMEQGREWLEIQVQGPGICACAQVEIADWTSLEGVRKTRGVSYRGAELIGLKLDAVETGEQTRFICQHIERVLD
jgi:hypothetical protein